MLATELARLNVDVMVTRGQMASLAAKEATSTIPIVMAGTIDPVAIGLVASLSRPGTNITGLSSMDTVELSAKRLQILKEILPQLSRVAVLGSSKETKAAAQSLGIQVYSIGSRNPADLKNAFGVAMPFQPDALLTDGTPYTGAHAKLIAAIANRNRLPSIYPTRSYVDLGGLVSYGPDLKDFWHHTAEYVDKILKGSKPADLPVQQPTKFELVINLNTAKALGLTIPPILLVRADDVNE